MLASVSGSPIRAAFAAFSGVAAGADPDRERRLDGTRRNLRVVERRPEPALPGDALRGGELEEKVELLGEQRVVVVEAAAEEREGFDERAAPGDDLGAAAGDEVDRGEILEHADRIEGREDRHRARDPDPLRPRRDRRHDDRRRRNRDVVPVMLAEGIDRDPGLVGEVRRGEDLGIALLDADHAPGGRVGRHVGEGVEADFHEAGSFLDGAEAGGEAALPSTAAPRVRDAAGLIWIKVAGSTADSFPASRTGGSRRCLSKALS